jgi:hypothetical protein
MKTNKSHKVGELDVNEEKLLQKGYRVSELAGKNITINSVVFKDGDNGEYAVCAISGDGIEEDKPLQTGAQNIMARLKAAVEQDYFPLECKVVKLGGSNAFDIE